MEHRSLIAGLSGIALGLAATGAFAHAHPEHKTPGDGAHLSKPPTRVQIEFDDPIEPAFSKLKVKNKHGDVVSHDSHVAGNDDKLLEAKLAKLKPGAFHVHWSVVARDTHHTAGDYTFTVKP